MDSLDIKELLTSIKIERNCEMKLELIFFRAYDFDRANDHWKKAIIENQVKQKKKEENF